jgi:hypothetical protein
VRQRVRQNQKDKKKENNKTKLFRKGKESK